MVEGQYSRTDLHGLETFFADPSIAVHPPRWKMAIVTWLGVWPTVFVVTKGLEPMVNSLPAWISTAIITLVVVVILTWGVMPFLTKIMHPWLKQNSDEYIAEGASHE